MSKFFIVNADTIAYHPKDVNGVRDNSITNNAIVLHMIKKTLTGFSTEDKFVRSDYDFYKCLANTVGTDLDSYRYLGVDIDCDTRGNVSDFSVVKKYESLIGVADFFGIPKSDK